MNKANENEMSHAERNAVGHAESMIALYRAYRQLDDREVDEVEIDGDTLSDVDEVWRVKQRRNRQ